MNMCKATIERVEAIHFHKPDPMRGKGHRKIVQYILTFPPELDRSPKCFNTKREAVAYAKEEGLL